MGEQNKSNLGIMYVDVIVSSPAHEPPADAAALPEVRDFLSLCQNVVTKRRGSVVKTAFDGAMFTFPDADSALLAGREMQIGVQNKTKVARDISIRIGLHYGAPITAGVAAQRVALLAGSGQIFTTGETLEWLSAHERDAICKRELPSRTKSQNVTVYEVMWQMSRNPDPLPEVPPPPIVQAGSVARLRLIYLGRETVVVSKITIGRLAGHAIELKDPRASRNHAYIERRQDKFVLVDQSSHGTFIRSKTGEEHRLQHGELVLEGSGVLSFAFPAGHQGAEVVGFSCEPAEPVVALVARR
jgi:hypothetical protein